jgi:quercetin 2,3-dioxygenase
MLNIRRSDERGQVDAGWLKSRHTFSFGHYRDPEWVAYRSLRVINEDWVAPGAGFPTHPHHEMEIVTYMLSGALAHEDSMGHGSTIVPGDVQRMSAGTGLTHSEFNASNSEPAELVQIWILPGTRGLAPSYEQTRFEEEALAGRFCLIASSDGREGSVTIHQDAAILAAKLQAGHEAEHRLGPGRGAWLQVLAGSVQAEGETLRAGDGAAVEGVETVRIRAGEAAHVLLFDLA